MKDRTKITILGGGVAGVSTAIALKLKGFDVTVYERHKAETNIGAGIVVWPNASYVLEKLGVLNCIKSISGVPAKMQRFSHTGESLGSIDIDAINEKMGYPSFSILRRDFQRVLTSKLNELGVFINYDHEVTQLQTKENKTSVYFKSGEIISADVVIGADGRMSSIARKHVTGKMNPVYQGFINWIGVIESSKKIFKSEGVSDFWGIGQRFGIVPISSGKAYWAGGIASKEIGKREPIHYKNELKKIFSAWPALVNEVIAQTPTAQINKIYVHDHDPIKVWHKGNVIVIGDAAHAALPTSGQGACQALEDAWHLANCINNNSTAGSAFTEFTQLRSEKTANIIASGRGLASSIFNSDPEYCKLRNENSKTTDYSLVAAGMAQAWGQNLLGV